MLFNDTVWEMLSKEEQQECVSHLSAEILIDNGKGEAELPPRFFENIVFQQSVRDFKVFLDW
jgi:hypothetical protein